MLHELLLSCIGFTGDIIVEVHGTYKVAECVELLTQAEREQANRIAALGWFYCTLLKYTEANSIRWSEDASRFQLYKAALCLGISDLLEEYCADIAELESRVVSEGPFPISYFIPHLQKYLIVMPAVYSVCQEIEQKKLVGCQILDHLTKFRSGVPIVNDVVQRLLLRVRTVFFRQCISWLIHGDVQDKSEEFFIQARQPQHGMTSTSLLLTKGSGKSAGRDNIYDRVVQRLLIATQGEGDITTAGAAEEKLDWNSSFYLKLDMLPESHVNARMSSKIMFCGKAVKLLQTAHRKADSCCGVSATTSSSPRLLIDENEVYSYITGSGINAMSSSSTSDHEEKEDKDDKDDKEDKEVAGKDSDHLPNDEYYESCGFSAAFMSSITDSFRDILINPEHCIELFEALVEKVNSNISRTLWELLDVQYGFRKYLLAMRNMYLIGKGELFQNILDGILDLLEDPSTPSIQDSDSLLNLNILRNAAKLVNLDEEAFLRAINMRVSVSNIVLKVVSTDHFRIAGSATSSKSGIKLISFTAPEFSEIFANMWAAHKANVFKHPVQESVADENGSYLSGSMWLLDQKYVAKGFSMSTGVSVDGETFRSLDLLTMSPSKHQGDRLLLGSISLVVHNTSAAVPAIGISGGAVAGTVSVGIGIYAHKVSTKYFLRLFVSAKGDGKSYFNRGVSMAASVVADSDNIEGTEYEVIFPMESKMRPWVDAGCKGEMLLEVEYAREITTGSDNMDVKKSMSSMGSVQYLMRIRVIPKSQQTLTTTVRTDWDLEVPIDISSYVRLQGGNASVGLIASGLFVDTNQSKEESRTSKSSCLILEVQSYEFKGRGALATYPVASSFTATRFPATFNRLDSMLNRYRAWMTLKLNFKFPDIFLIIFDSESLNAYERIFSMLMKIRLVAHALERVWMKSTGLAKDRIFCYIRHSMHFFVSNLMYYMQVDVIDSEFAALVKEIETACDFQIVLRAHRNFLASLVRLAMVDNLAIQEAIERILQVCLRFVAVCRIRTQESGAAGRATVTYEIPPEEMEAIQKDFYSHVLYFFQIMQKVENRGFVFRLDFNGYLSQMASTLAAGGSGSKSSQSGDAPKITVTARPI